jgi:lipoyl synthase
LDDGQESVRAPTDKSEGGMTSNHETGAGGESRPNRRGAGVGSSQLSDSPPVEPVVSPPLGRRPDWLRVRLPQSAEFARTRGIVHRNRLHTVCESAACPNIGECWSAGTATFMILGNVCTRSCGFCNVLTGRPTELDQEEPERVADAIASMNLIHVVITSVDRDELQDGGAAIWAQTIQAVRRRSPKTRIEVLIPDFKGVESSFDLVLAARPDILAHNCETVPRLQRTVRPQARYERSLGVLAYAHERGFITKSSLMLGLGEEAEEVREVMRDLRRTGVDILTLGQYLQPTRRHLPVQRYVTPDEFAAFADEARALEFGHVESGPLVRSSYHAERAEKAIERFFG